MRMGEYPSSSDRGEGDDFEQMIVENMSSIFMSATSGDELDDHRVGGKADVVPYSVSKDLLENHIASKPTIETPFGLHITRRLGELADETISSLGERTFSERGTLRRNGNTDSGSFPDDPS